MRCRAPQWPGISGWWLSPVGPSFGEPWCQPLLEHFKKLRSHPDVVLEAWYVSVVEVSQQGVVGPFDISL